MTKEVQLNIVNEEKYCSICGEELDINMISYCKSCRAKYNKNYYINNKQYFKDYYREQIANKRFVYSLIGKDDRVLYVGSTSGKYRAIHHLQGHSQLGLYPKDWEQLGLDRLIYADVTSITRNKEERYFLEKLYIQMYQPILNSDNEPDPLLELERIESFIDLVYNQYIEFREIDIKITLQDSKVRFNYNDLILQ